MSHPSFPSPEELHKKLEEVLRKSGMQFGSGFSAKADAGPPEPEDAAKKKRDRIHFPHTPKQVKAHLDRFVIKQDEAKKALAIAVCDHYNQINAVERGENATPYVKQNIVIAGPTGVGKTYMVKCLADLIGVPMVKADATKFTETGYVGGDVEDLVRDLVQQAEGDVKLAQYGIIYLDEADKLASAQNASGRDVSGRDVSGRGVQTNLLKLMEETDVPIRSANDLQAQIAAAMEFQRGGKKKQETINTRYILFIVSGAFDRLADLVAKRVSKAEMGFHVLQHKESAEDLLKEVTTRDFIDYGMEPEFIGRLPVRVACSALNVDDLYTIMKTSEGSIVRQYERAFQAYGIEAVFSDDGLRAFAEKASTEQTGARALMTVCERTLRDFKFELPGGGLRQLVINRDVVENPARELQRILSDGKYEARVAMAEKARAFAAHFEEHHQLRLVFSQDAIQELIDGAMAAGHPMPEHCEAIFKDFEFGLKLVSKNSGQKEFPIDAHTVRNSDKVLSEWVVKSYAAAATRESNDGAAG